MKDKLDERTMREVEAWRARSMSAYRAIDRRQASSIRSLIASVTDIAKEKMPLAVEDALFELGRADGFRQDLGACFDDMTGLVDRLLRLLGDELASTKQEKSDDRTDA